MSKEYFSSESANSKHVPLGWRKKTLVSAVALALMGSVALPVSAWAASVQGIKFNDANGNGVHDSGEAVFSGHVLQLIYQNADGTTGDRWNTKTGQDGRYVFGSLIGNGDGEYTLEMKREYRVVLLDKLLKLTLKTLILLIYR